MILLCIKSSDNPKAESKQFLCDVLQKYCGIANPLDLLTYTEHGKPVIEGAVFSVSHSDSLLCVAVQCDSVGESLSDYLTYNIETDSVQSSIGVDIERIDNKTIDRCAKIAKAKFFDSEQTALQLSANYVDTFCEMWTKKESYCKYTGVGLPDALSFDTVSEHNEITIYTEKIVKDSKSYSVSVCYNSRTEK